MCQKALDACQGGNPRTCWWTPVMREAAKLKRGGGASLKCGGLLRQPKGTKNLCMGGGLWRQEPKDVLANIPSRRSLTLFILCSAGVEDC